MFLNIQHSSHGHLSMGKWVLGSEDLSVSTTRVLKVDIRKVVLVKNSLGFYCFLCFFLCFFSFFFPIQAHL